VDLTVVAVMAPLVHNMDFITFIKALFFGKVILLTPSPIDVTNEWLEIKLGEPLQAITSGASLDVRFSRKREIFVGAKDSNDFYQIANKAFPNGTITAELIDNSGDKITLFNRIISVSKEHVFYSIVSNEPLPTNRSFAKVRIRSSREIKGVELLWKNYKH